MRMITLGPLSFPLLPLLLVAGMLASLALARRKGTLAGDLESGIYGVLIVAILAARLAFVVLHWGVYAQAPIDMLDIRDGGFFPLVGAGAGVVSTVIYLLRNPALTRALLSCLLVGTSVAALGGVMARAITTPVSMTLPTASFTDVDGKVLRLDRLRGKPVVVNLWATWCPPCRREMPVLMHAQASMPGVVFIFANQGEAVQTVRQYLENEHIDIANVILDSRLDVARLAGSSALPTTLFFDVHGKLRDTRMGAMSAASLADELETIAVPR